MNESNLTNGEIKELRDKLNNEHIKFEPNLLNNNRFEIYSVLKDKSTIKIGDIEDSGIMSDFFIDDNMIYVRYANILRGHDKIKIKKNVCKL